LTDQLMVDQHSEQLSDQATGNKQMCESADVAMGKRWIKSAHIKCGCMGKNRCADKNCCL